MLLCRFIVYLEKELFQVTKIMSLSFTLKHNFSVVIKRIILLEVSKFKDLHINKTRYITSTIVIFITDGAYDCRTI